jgi:DNA-binding PadR family transcriptional regulator
MRSSPLALAVLGLLMAGPMHPYGMQRLLRQWGKDQVINVGQRANLYKTIRRLHEAGLVEVRQTERDQLYPERTVYELTEAGQQAAHEWLDDMLAVPRPEYPPFPAALSFAMLAGPDGLRDALERRAAVLGRRLAAMEADLERYSAGLPRVTLLDDEYRRAVLAAELTWISGLIEALRTGELTWTRDDLAGLATAELAQAGMPPAEPAR